MTYQKAVELFRIQYEVLSDRILNDEKILTFISISQADIQHRFGVIRKNSRENTTAQTTCIVGTAIHTIGTGATNIPNDLHDIYMLNLDDDIKTEVKPVGISNFRNISKPSGKPYYYALDGEGDDMVLELETEPDSAYVMTILYIQKFELFTGDNTDTTWGDFDKPASGWGGSLKLKGWENLIVQGALAKAIDPLNIKGFLTIWKQDCDTYKQTEGIRNSSGNIPAFDGVTNSPVTRIPGQDEPRN